MPHALFCAFNRFGILSDMISMIKYIHQEISFFIREGMNESSKRSQQSAIVQGCLLAPFLFSIALTILMTDVQSYMDERYPQAVHD